MIPKTDKCYNASAASKVAEASVDKAVDNRMTIVVPSLPDRAEATVLVIMSIIHFFVGEFKILLVGDGGIKSLFADGRWCESKIKEHEDIIREMPFDWTDYQKDIPEVLKMVLADEESSENFIFWPANCFLIRNVGIHHILLPKAAGLLRDTAHKDIDVSTLNFLREALSHDLLYNYDCGVPLGMNKQVVADIMTNHTDGKDVNFLTVYGNASYFSPIMMDWKVDNWRLPVISKKPLRQNIERFADNKFMISYMGDGPLPKLLEQIITDIVV